MYSYIRVDFFSTNKFGHLFVSKFYTHITLCGKSISWQQVVLGLVVVLVVAQCDTGHSGTGEHGRGKQVI